MKLISINEELDFEKIYNFCKSADQDDKPAANNMSVQGWENNRASLLNVIYKQKRFDKNKKADYFFLENDNQYIAGSGFYQLDSDPNICVLGVRTYTITKYRSQLLHGNLILPKQKEIARQLEYKSLIMTFNEYNRWLFECIKHLSYNNGKLLGNRVPEFYKNWSVLDFKIKVKSTDQLCCYQHLDNSYDETFFKSLNILKI